MKNRKPFFIIIGLCFLIFFSFIAYWTIIPRHGTIEYEGEGIYTGQLRGMSFHGYGTWVSYEMKGITYEGEWRDSQFHGEGILTFYDGSQIIGQFENGQLVGKGMSISADGTSREVDYGEMHQGDECTDCGHDNCDHDQ